MSFLPGDVLASAMRFYELRALAADGGISSKWGRLWRYAPTPRRSELEYEGLDDHRALAS